MILTRIQVFSIMEFLGRFKLSNFKFSLQFLVIIPVSLSSIVFSLCTTDLHATVKRKKTDRENSKINSKREDSLKSDLEETLKWGMKNRFTKGGYISVYKNNRMILEIGKRYNRDTLLPVASLSKSFTALAILKLAEENSLNLKDSVSTYIPEFNSINSKIRIKDLLHHHSGIPYEGSKSNYTFQLENKQFTLPSPVLGIGVKYIYSNYNYRILGKIIEIVSNKNPSEYIQEKILNPLELDRVEFSGVYDCASGINISPENLLKYASIYLKESKVEDLGLFERKSFKKIYSRAYPHDKYNYYGLGWHVLVSEKEKRVVSLFHSGIGDYNFGQLRIFPGSKSIFFFQTEHTGLNRREFNSLNQRIETKLLQYIHTGS